MFNKNDPLIGAVQKIMNENSIRRSIEEKLNEELGIASKKALPHEHHANYDALLEERLAEALGGSIPKTPKEKDLAAKHGDPNRITKGDVLKARGVLEDAEDTKASVKKAASVNNVNKDMNVCEDEQIDEVLNTKKGREFAAKAAAKAYIKNAYKSPTKETEKKLAKVDRVWAKHDKEDDKATGKKTIRTSSPLYDYNEEVDLQEKAVSKAQHRLMGAAYAAKKSGKAISPKIAKIAASMSKGQLKDYAKTKEKGLPEKVSEETNIDSIMEEIAFNLNEKANAMLKSPFHEAAAFFSSLDEEQIGMLDEGLWDSITSFIGSGARQDAANRSANANAARVGDNPGAIKAANAPSGTTPVPAPSGPRDSAPARGPVGTADQGMTMRDAINKSPALSGKFSPDTGKAITPSSSMAAGRAAERSVATPAPASAPATSTPRTSERVASQQAGVPDSRNLRTAVKPAAGEGQTGKALAASGVSKADRLDPNFLKSQGISGKPGSAEANMALASKMQAQRTAVANAENAGKASIAAKPATAPITARPQGLRGGSAR